MSQLIFDGHNDVLLRLWDLKSGSAAHDFVRGDGAGQIDLPRLHAGRMFGGFFAMFAPDPEEGLPEHDDLNPPYANALVQKQALATTLGMLDIRDQIVALAKGAVALCHTAAELRNAMQMGAIAWVTHIEGAEAITPDLSNLQNLYDRGLRSIGPVWSRPNVFGVGVPFRFPSSPDLGRGLTTEGFELVRACNQLRVLVDLSHLTERGFWDVAETSDAPLVATHSNAHKVCASSRNLNDDQLRAIGETMGMVGLNFATGFLRADGLWSTDTPAETMLRHLDHMIAIAGEDCVGLGSDFDGARIPRFIKDAAGLPNLVRAMETHGYGKALIAKLCSENWLRVLEKTWGS